MTPEASLWLIKSNGRILGPFNRAHIFEMLRTREISVLDEASFPMRRWQSIQYHEAFSEIVEQIRRTNVSERTEATWTPTGSTAGLTQTVTDLVDFERTEEISNLSNFSQTGKEIVIHNIPEQNISRPVTPGAGRFQPQGVPNTVIQRQVESTTRGLWLVTVLVLMAVAVFIVQRRIAKNPEQVTSFSSLKQNVINAVQAGQYPEALKLLKNYYPDPSQAGELAVYYGPLLIQLEGQTVLGRRILSSVISTKRPEVKQAYTGLAVADMIDGQMDSARDNLSRALAIDPGYQPALLNQAALALMKHEFSVAKTMAFKTAQGGQLSGEAMMIIAEAQVEDYKSGGSAAEFGPIHRAINDYLNRQWDYTPELGLYSLYMELIRQQKISEETLQAYLDRDPQLTQDHRHNILVYRGHTQWKNLEPLCAEISAKSGDGARLAVLRAACFTHASNWDQARQWINKANQQDPKDALTQAWQSYILSKSGNADQASAVLGHATDLNRRGEFILPILLQGRFCQLGHLVDCARDSWQRLYGRSFDHLPAIAGMVWVHSALNAKNESAKMLEKGLKISSDYIPLLILRQKLEKEGVVVN